jgi:hypothetical protein
VRGGANIRLGPGVACRGRPGAVPQGRTTMVPGEGGAEGGGCKKIEHDNCCVCGGENKAPGMNFF